MERLIRFLSYRENPPLTSYMGYSDDPSDLLELGTIYPNFVRRFYSLINQGDISATELDKFSDCINLSNDGTRYFRRLLLDPDTLEELDKSEYRLSFQLMHPKAIAYKYRKKIHENPAKFKLSPSQGVR